jgi:alkanesulfonate monooxygenase SsuD/methylene tetrahydromethanopterin reductase-like flavin-dependent oxidoreductase (luciferase family)
LKDSPGLPKPVQQPHPPLIVGGGGPKRTPRLAATFADEFNLPFSSLADTEAQFARVRTACEDKGRDPATLRLSAAQTVCCGANDAEVERGRQDRPQGGRAARQRRGRHARRGGGAAPGVRRLGAGSVYLQVLDLDDLDHLALLSEQVLPHLA